MTSQQLDPLKKYDCQYVYGNQSIPYTIWSNTRQGSIERVLFLGTVQVGELALWVAQSCPPNTVVVQGAPHWIAKEDGSDIPEFMFGFTRSAFNEIIEKFSVSKVHILAESQSAPGVIELFTMGKYRAFLDALTLIQPLGLNSSAYSGTDEQRLDIFKRRIAANAFRQFIPLLVDRRLRRNHWLVNKTVDLRSTKARAQYNSGLQYDAVPSLKLIYGYCQNIAIVSGENDKIFPAIEIIDTLKKGNLDIDVQIIHGIPHSPLSTKSGSKLLRNALDMSKKTI